METKRIEGITWYRDSEALSRGEPGIRHSYIASLATVLQSIGVEVDPVWLMGTSGFAFRLYIAQNMCPSCMSVFEWKRILAETIKQTRFNAKYISRMWEEEDKEAERREMAHRFIRDGINRQVPAIGWDLIVPEWGLVIGYDDQRQQYETLWEDRHGTLPYNKLGKNGINILSVTVLNKTNQRDRREQILHSLQIAVAHAEQKEWMDRPQYQDGLPAYDVWAQIMDSGAKLTRAGKIQNVGEEVPDHILYHAAHHYSARCYAREYLHGIADGNEVLKKAANCYAEVADFLKPVYETFTSKEPPDEKTFLSLADTIRHARGAEEQGIGYIRQYLAK